MLVVCAYGHHWNGCAEAGVADMWDTSNEVTVMKCEQNAHGEGG